MLNQDFKEFIQLLNANNVRYLVVGGYAVAVHGHPRYTKDIDIWIEMTPENAVNLLEALKQFGFGSLDLQIEDFLTPQQVIQLGYPPNRIDLLTTVDGVNFTDCYSSKFEIEINEILIDFIDLDNLKKNKKASGRMRAETRRMMEREKKEARQPYLDLKDYVDRLILEGDKLKLKAEEYLLIDKET